MDGFGLLRRVCGQRVAVRLADSGRFDRGGRFVLGDSGRDGRAFAGGHRHG
jgi:hypothetical protein